MAITGWLYHGFSTPKEMSSWSNSNNKSESLIHMRKTCASCCHPSRCPGSVIWELNATSALISRDPPWPIEESPSICWQCWRMRQPECYTMQQDATQLWSVERNIMHRHKVLKLRNVWGLWSNWPNHGRVQFGLSSTPLFTGWIFAQFCNFSSLPYKESKLEIYEQISVLWFL